MEIGFANWDAPDFRFTSRADIRFASSHPSKRARSDQIAPQQKCHANQSAFGRKLENLRYEIAYLFIDGIAEGVAALRYTVRVVEPP